MLKVWKKGQPIPEGFDIWGSVMDEYLYLKPFSDDKKAWMAQQKYTNRPLKSYSDLCVELLKKEGE